MATDWHVLRKNEVQIKWDYEEYGAMMINDTMAYDGVKLYNPLNGRTWNNIVEVLESEVKRDYAMSHGPNEDVFKKNDGYFWSILLQQWHDHCNVSTFSSRSFVLKEPQCELSVVKRQMRGSSWSIKLKNI